MPMEQRLASRCLKFRQIIWLLLPGAKRTRRVLRLVPALHAVGKEQAILLAERYLLQFSKLNAVQRSIADATAE